MSQAKPTTIYCNQFDVTGRINVTNPDEVCNEVCAIFKQTHGNNQPLDSTIRVAFQDFHKLYSGNYDNYHACDTLYHDIQHTLDMSLAMARLLYGYEQQYKDSSLGALRFALGIVTSLFHDSGYIRKKNHDTASNGAFYTLSHVSRSGEFLKQYLPRIQMEEYIEHTTELVHFTGYETAIEDIKLANPKDQTLGYLLGTADLLAQLSDRCYLEKCRDRLFPEFVLGGLVGKKPDSHFKTAEELLLHTPQFFETSVLTRLDDNFESIHKVEAQYFNGQHLYMNTIRKNMDHLKDLIKKGSFDSLKRCPPETQGDADFPFFEVSAELSNQES